MTDPRSSDSAQPIPTPERALAIGAHPDDVEFGAGGTLARWAGDGCHVTMLIVTDGAKGTWDEQLEVEELVRMRRKEQGQAAEIIGATEVVFLDHRDGELEYSLALREEMCLWIRRLSPSIVLGHDPWRRYLLHPDHRAAGWGVVDGVVAARDHLFFPNQLTEGLTRHRPDWVLLWAPDEPDHWEDVSSTLDRKVQALLCHRSQGTSTMGEAQHDEWRRDFAERVAERAAAAGAAAGLAAAEEFRRIRP